MRGQMPCVRMFALLLRLHGVSWMTIRKLGPDTDPGGNQSKAGQHVAENSLKKVLTKLGLRKARHSGRAHAQAVRRPSQTAELAELSSRQRLVFLAGPPRSGTTWLNREICNHPGWSGFLPECTLLTQQIGLYSRTKHFCEPTRFEAYLGNVDNLAATYRPMMALMLALAVRLNGYSDQDVLVLKDSELSHYLDDLVDILPDHRLICIVRDPRDVIASVKNVAKRKQEAWDLEKTAAWIYSYYSGLQKHRPNAGSNTLFVRNEDLVAGQLPRVRDFLGQSAEDVLEDPEAIKARLDPSDPFFSDLYLKPTTKQKVGSYVKDLTKDEIAYIDKIFAGVMKAWRYA